jgi:hypothetical protein
MEINFPPSYYAPEYLQIHRRALKNTIYGAGNVIKVEIDSGKITYVMNSTGKRFDDMNAAFNAADQSGLTGFARVTGGGPGQSGSMRGLGGFNERARSIKEMLRTDSTLRDSLSFINSPADKLSFTIGSARIPQGALETAKNVLKDVSKGKGFMFQTKDSGTFVRAFVNGEELTDVQLNELLYKTSGGAGGLFSNEQILKSLKDGQLGELFQKAAKRGKGIFSLDGISLAGNDLLNLAKGLDAKSAAFSSFGDSVKIFDTEKDLAKIALAHLDDISSNKGRVTLTGEDLVRKAMAGLSSTEIEEAAAYYGKSGALQSAINSMESLGIISRKNGGIARLTKKYPEIEEALRDPTKAKNLKGQALVRYEELMEQFKRPYDGSTLINEKFIQGMRKNMQAELKALEAKGLANLSPEEIEKRKFLKSDIDNAASGMDAETIRFNFMRNGRTFNIKGVGTTAELDDRLAHYSTITSEANIKKELAIMGQTDMANIILQGRGKDLVFEDPLAPAFHGEIFSSQEAIDSTAERGNRILASYQEALKTGDIDPRLRKQIYERSKIAVDSLPTEFRTGAERSKRYASLLVEALESGRDIRQMPQLSSYLMNFVQSEIAREKDGILQPVMENVYRFSIDSELAYYSGRKVGKATLQDVANFRLSSGGNEIGLMNFKIRGHKMLTSGNAANIFHHSLGTFDLDDKGIPMMRTMDIFDQNKQKIGERIGFFTFRQPTGPGEYVLSMAEFDTETIRATFGKNQSYVATLNDMVAKGTATLDQKLLHEIISPEDMTAQQMLGIDTRHAKFFADQASIHETMIQTMKDSKTPIAKISQDIINDLNNQKYGSTLAMSKDKYDRLIKAGVFDEKQLTANYRQGNIFKLFAESGAYDFEKDSIQQILDETSLFSSSERAEIGRLSAIDGMGVEIQDALAKMMQAGTAEQVAKKELFISNLTVREFGIKQLRAAETADSLGLYINRLTMVTASTRQGDEILKHLDAADVLNLKQNYKVGLIDPGQAIDYAITMNSRANIKGDISRQHYTEEVYNALTSSIRNSAEKGADLRGVQLALAKLTGKAGSDAAGVLSQVGSQAIEEQGRYIGALRALAYKKGIEDPDLLAGADKMILKQRLKAGDNAAYLKGIIEGFEAHSSEIDPANELANKFIASLRNAGDTNEKINETLVNTIGIRSGKYAAISQMTENAARVTAGMRAASQTFGIDRGKAFMGEATLTAEGRQAASQVLNLQEKMSKELDEMFSGAVNGEADMSEKIAFRNAVESEMMGQKLHASILDSANTTNSSIQEVIDSIDTMSSMRRGIKDLTSYRSGGDDPDELAKLVQGARDSRAMSHYKRQDGLMDLVDQYDALKSSPKVKEQLDLYNIRNLGRRSYGADPVIDLAMEAMNVGEHQTIKDLGLSEEMSNQVRDIRRASEIRESLTPQLQDLLSRRGSAIDLAPTALDDADRVAMLGDEGVDESTGLVRRNYKRIGDSFRDGAMKKAFENPTVRKAGYAGLAIIAASFAFQHSKGRSPEDVGGPPLLPGGSAYEQMPQRSPQIPQSSMFSGYNQGTSYSVNLEGSSDQINSFRSAAGSVAPGSVNSTMYKGLPNLGSDPYSQVASSF